MTFSYPKTHKKKNKHYDAHVTTAHITAKNETDAKKKAVKTLKVRES